MPPPDPLVSPLLAIDTAGSACSAAIVRAGVVLAAERRPLRHGHGEALLPAIDRVSAMAGIAPTELGAVAVATGPGGFTGIRVGLAAAQGIGLALGVPVVGVTSFAAVLAALAEIDRAVLVALDSRRADLYVQLFAMPAALPLAPAQAILPIDLAAYVAGLVGATPLLLAGDATAAAAAALAGRPAIGVAADSAPDALGVAMAATACLRAGQPCGPARPFYLRPPDVSLPSRRRPAATPA